MGIFMSKKMDELEQAVVLVYDNLVSTLVTRGYHSIPHTVGLWANKTRPTTFCLCVDDLSIKYFDKADVDHLLHVLGTKYTF